MDAFRAENVGRRTTTSSADARGVSTAGIAYAVLAYASWGTLPVYWKALQSVPVAEVLAHGVLWSSLFVALLVSAARE